MRIIDYYNITATVLELLVVILAVSFSIYQKKKGKPCWVTVEQKEECGKESVVLSRQDWTNTRWYTVAVILAFLSGLLLRMVNLNGIPLGLNQDEASIGYEAYSLAHYGIDRNGYAWPVYPITWGSGGGSPLMIYLNVISTSLFGSSIWSLRLVPAFLGSLTLLLFYVILLMGYGKRTALAGLVVLALTPWHIMLSRWSLDSNTMPFWQLLATFVFLLSLTKTRRKSDGSGNTFLLCLASFLFGVCMYSYGSANLVIPLTLIFLSIWGLRHRAFNIKQLGLCFFVFVLTCVPLGMFYAINYLGFPEIQTDWISFPRFASSHFSSVFISLDASFPKALWANVRGLFLTLTVGMSQEMITNAIPGYWVIYCFTWPVLFLGIAVGGYQCWKDRKKKVEQCSAVNAVMMSELFAGMCFALLIEQNINRNVLLFPSVVYCFVLGLRFIYHATEGIAARAKRGTKKRGVCSHILFWLSMALFCIGFSSFAKDYYGGYYNEIAASDFMPGYGEAVLYADEMAKQIDASQEQENEDDPSIVYSTYNLVNSPFMVALYYLQYDPNEFIDTVVYKDPAAEFRVASSFGNFVFGLPVEDTGDLSSLLGEEYENDVFILTKEEIEQFDEEQYSITWFEDRFAVVVKRQSE